MEEIETNLTGEACIVLYRRDIWPPVWKRLQQTGQETLILCSIDEIFGFCMEEMATNSTRKAYVVLYRRNVRPPVWKRLQQTRHKGLYCAL